MSEDWKKIIAKKARDVIDDSALGKKSVVLLSEDATPEDFICALEEAGLLLDAAKTLAWSLPRREAVWWACLCVQDMQSLKEHKGEQLALSAAEKWVFDPTDERRVVAFQTVQQNEVESGGMLCAMATAFSEPTLPMGDDEKLELDSSRFNNMVYGAIAKSAMDDGAGQMNSRLLKYLRAGREIAKGGSGKPGQAQGS